MSVALLLNVAVVCLGVLLVALAVGALVVFVVLVRGMRLPW